MEQQEVKQALAKSQLSLDRVIRITEEIQEELIGNPKYGRTGLVGEVKDLKRNYDLHDKQIKKLQDQHFKEKVVAGSIGAALAFVGKTAWFKLISIFH